MLAMLSNLFNGDGIIILCVTMLLFGATNSPALANWFAHAREENLLSINVVLTFLLILILFTAVYVLKTH